MDTVAEIKNRLSITDVVAPYVKVVKAGKSLRGLCPFHKEKTPSFHLSPDRGTYHCFGCGEGGDMFSFVQKVEGVDFKGALKLLAEKAGVELVFDPSARESASRAERLREALARATEFYASRLTESSDAYAYAKKRGLTDETIRSWNLGVAPDDWRVLLEHLAGQGFSTAELLLAGLIKEADGKPGTYYDRFRNRLMFPIRDSAGRTVGFTGRALPAGRQGLPEVEQAKYLNSPETELYHKSEIFFGMDRAKDAIRTRGFALLVEGQMDLLHAHQAGFENAIALSGTALGERHLTLLKRYSENLLLALDADSAGLTATLKSAQLALKGGMKVKAARLPEGKDPADLILEDPKIFTACIKEAKPVVEFFLLALASKEKDPHRLVTHAERIVLPLISAIQSPMEREHFVGITARALGLSPEAVRSGLNRLPREGEAPKTPIARAKASTSEKESRGMMIAAALASYPETALAKRIETEYARITGAPLALLEVPESALFATEQAFGEEPTEDSADGLLRAFEEAVIREAYQEAVMALRRAEASRDPKAIEAAQTACTTLSQKLGKLPHTSK